MAELYVGAPGRRKEDPEMLTGEARYISDVSVPGMLTAKVVRSPLPHARIRSIDTSAALALNGVAAVYTAADLGPAQRHLGSFGQFPPSLLDQWLPKVRPVPVTTLATDKVRYVGEPVALVVAADRYLAEDAVELVEVDYDPLEPVVDAEQAIQPGAAEVHEDALGRALVASQPWRSWCTAAAQWSETDELSLSWDRNTAIDMTVGIGDVDAAFTGAAHVFAERYHSHRYTGVPLEGRGILAMPDIAGSGMTVWSSHQIPHFHRALIAESLEIPEETVRVAQAFLGGGFGQKAGIYGEDVLIPFAARMLAKPVKWLEDKREHFQASSHSREQTFDAEIAVDAEGRIAGLRYEVLIDVGAYLTFPVVLPYLGVCHVLGPYRVPALQARIRSILTNKVTSAPYRGAGRPEVVFMLNRLLDRVARELEIDPTEIRKRNFIAPEEMPYDPGILYRDGAPMVLDSGDYPRALEENLAGIEYDSFREAQTRAREQGRYLGIGISCNIEAGGIGPVEGARVQITPQGEAIVHLGVVDTGQGQRTVYAQICAAALGLDIDKVSVRTGDSGGIIYSRGTYHSRAAVTAGNAVSQAAYMVAQKLKHLASHHLGNTVQGGVRPAQLELAGGAVRVSESPELSITIAQCARLCVPDGSSVAAATASGSAILNLPDSLEPGLDETSFFSAKSVVWGNASHAAIVEVDPDLGTFEILRYVVAHDVGRMLNPLLVNGQVHGGVAQGIGGAVLEELVYGQDGQLVSSNMTDYMLPRRSDIPKIEVIGIESPSPMNPLGAKGAGEGGTIGPPAALAAAVEDALLPFGVRITRTPLSPAVILGAIRDAKAENG